MSKPHPHVGRRIRSFVKREGRLTQGQQRALDTLFPKYGIQLQQGLLEFEKLYHRKAPCILEIGFGNGASLAEMAKLNPENNYLGIEVHSPGLGNLLSQIEEMQLSNIRLSNDDAIEVLTTQVQDGSLDAVYLFFPDPWHKRNHHKRRIVQDDFVDIIRDKLKINGHLHMATDWEDYAKYMMKILSRADGFENEAGIGNYIERPETRPLTKFELRGKQLGHGVRDLIFTKSK